MRGIGQTIAAQYIVRKAARFVASILNGEHIAGENIAVEKINGAKIKSAKRNVANLSQLFTALAASVAFTALSTVVLSVNAAASEPQIGDCIALMFTKGQSKQDANVRQLYHEAVANGWAVRLIDGSEEPSFAKRWHIENYPTIVLVRNSREFDRLFTAPTFESLANRMLAVSNPESLRVSHLNRTNSGTLVRGQSPSSASVPSTSTNLFDPSGRAQPTVTAISNRADGVQPWSQVAPASAVVPAVASAVSTTSTLPSNPAEATVRIRVDEPNFEVFGTGTIIDAHQGEALVLTCGHLFRDAKPSSKIVVETFIGGVAKAYPAILIDFKADETDIGLVAFRPEGPIAIAKLVDHRESLQEGAPVFSWGCDNGQVPSRRDSRITKLNRYLGEPNVEVYGAPVQGRSGGGLFNSKGELIGVCYAADNELNEGLYNAPQVVYNQLNRLGLQRLYSHLDANPGQIASVQPAAMQSNAAAGSVAAIPHGPSAALFQPASNHLNAQQSIPQQFGPQQSVPQHSGPQHSASNQAPVQFAGGANSSMMSVTVVDEFGRPQVIQVSPEMMQAIRNQGQPQYR